MYRYARRWSLNPVIEDGEPCAAFPIGNLHMHAVIEDGEPRSVIENAEPCFIIEDGEPCASGAGALSLNNRCGCSPRLPPRGE